MAKLRHVAICTKDPEGTAEFFQRFFDLTLVERADVGEYAYIFLTDGYLNIALLDFRTEAAAHAFGVDGGPGFVGVHHVGFIVEDPHAVLARLKAAGQRVIEPPTETGKAGVHFEAKVYDPNGILVDIGTAWPGVGR
jgi:catechol 2,3-dioxygenase-like lactoylglutathione lyase family enzyme